MRGFAVYVDLQDVGLSFTIKFMNEHLDLFWHSTGQVITDSHGIIGELISLCFAHGILSVFILDISLKDIATCRLLGNNAHAWRLIQDTVRVHY